MNNVINIGNRREVLWDNFLIDEEKTNTMHRMFHLTEKEICTVLDQGKELDSVSYLQVLKVPNGYRMYYCPWSQWDEKIIVRLAVLESTDGINWMRPCPDIFPHPELKENNIVMDSLIDNAFVFYDENPACPSEKKYKLLCSEYNEKTDASQDDTILSCYTSPDGYHFEKANTITELGTFDTLNTCHWRDGKYYCYIRDFHNYEPGKKQTTGIRDIRVLESEDFINWTVPEQLIYEDGLDYPMYTNNIHPYERAPHILVGFPIRYYDRKKWTKNLEQFKSADIKRNLMKIEERLATALTDCVFMHSRDKDGKIWHRHNAAFLTPGYETDENWMYGDCYLAYNMIDSGKETYYMYCNKNSRTRGKGKEIMRYEIRKDGFGCIMAEDKEKFAVTKPIRFCGNDLHVNFETSAFGYIYVDVLDESGNEIPNKTSVEIFGNNIDRKVYFEDGSDFSEYKDKTIRLRFRMYDAKLYSIKFE